MFGLKKTKQKKINDRLTWIKSDYAQHYFSNEAQYWKSALMQISGPTIVQLGRTISPVVESQLDYPLQVMVRSVVSEATSQKELSECYDHTLCADSAFLPLQQGSISSLIMPHVLETHELPHQVLREAHRVLVSDGYLVLTGFNPYSFLSLQRYVHSKAVYKAEYYSLNRVKDWLQLLGFEVAGSAMFQYAPLIKSNRLRKLTAFLELLGDRWLPMFGGGYMIVAKKRDVGTTFIGTPRFERPLVRLGHVTAKVTNVPTMNRENKAK